MKLSSSQNSLFITPNSSLIQQDSSSSSPSFLISNSPEERSSQVKWSWEENKVFENALAEFGIDESELLLSTLALRIPTKTTSQFREHLKALEDDINMIESSDFDEILNLLKSDDTDDDSSQAISKNIINEQEAPKKLSEASSRSVPRERRKPIPWAKTEHELFILGLERYGRGDWKSISRHLVPSKTPAQIASHAQKYFMKLNNPKSRPRKD